MDAPLVSVIMPAYNSADFIGDAIRSVQEQTYSNWELLVIDDASKDDTAAVTEEFQKSDLRIHLLRNPVNSGAGISRNKGIETASGRFIAFLDADDIWLREKLELQVNLMLQENISMTYSSYFILEEQINKETSIVQALPKLDYKKLLRSNYVGNLTAIYDVSRIGKVYAPSMRKRQDWGLWLRILQKTGSAIGIDKPLAIYRLRKNSISKNKIALLRYNFNIYYQTLDLGLLKSSSCFLRFLWEHFAVKPRQVKKIKRER